MKDEGAAPPLSLGGSLEDFPLADVLTFLNMGQKTGAIEVISDRSTARIYLEGGEVVHASTRASRLSLPAFLAARGLLAEGRALELEQRARREGHAFRELVLEARLVDADELANVEKILCCEVAFEAMAWKNGKFAFIRGKRPEGTQKLRISVQNLILEGARRLDEAQRYRGEEELDRSLVVTLLCATSRLEQQVVLTPVEWGIISLINAKRSLEEIFALAPTSDADTWSVLQRLEAARLIQIHKREEEPVTELVSPDDARSTLLIQRPKPEPEMEDKPTIPLAAVQGLADSTSDVRLITGDEVTTSHGMFGRRLPARLVTVPEGDEPVVAFELARPVMTLGRIDSNDIVLPHPSVSKQHAQLTQDGDGWKLTDLKSTNGTRVNEKKVTEVRLMPGDRLQIGAYGFDFDAVRL